MAQKRYFKTYIGGEFEAVIEKHSAREVLIDVYGVTMGSDERAKAAKAYTAADGRIVSYVPTTAQAFAEFEALQTALEAVTDAPAAQTLPDVAAQITADNAAEVFSTPAESVPDVGENEARARVRNALAIVKGDSEDSAYDYELAEQLLTPFYATLVARQETVNPDLLKAVEKALDAIRFSDADDMELRLGFVWELLTDESQAVSPAQKTQLALSLFDIAKDESDYLTVERLLADVQHSAEFESAELHALATGALAAVKAGDADGSHIAAHNAIERLLGAYLVAENGEASAEAGTSNGLAAGIISGSRSKRRREAARERARSLTALAQSSALLAFAFFVGQCLAIALL